MLFIDAFLVKKISFLNKFSIPSPVVGGLLFALIIFALHSTNVITIRLYTSLQSLFMLVFFTTASLGANFKLIKMGGNLLIWHCLFFSSYLHMFFSSYFM
ncbi:sodium/glutamate symporter [Jeotgalicoccus coquinae]|uniref:Sodium--glutamate symport carrier gltS n=1 Tax=Jeotgalicoccus coquinae TaxID=709509 RepID=A0ABR6QQP4_9STAP|nr:sodium--glutamate symport carrier gltS [Jeotgalicoccus coquinae]